MPVGPVPWKPSNHDRCVVGKKSDSWPFKCDISIVKDIYSTILSIDPTFVLDNCIQSSLSLLFSWQLFDQPLTMSGINMTEYCMDAANVATNDCALLETMTAVSGSTSYEIFLQSMMITVMRLCLWYFHSFMETIHDMCLTASRHLPLYSLRKLTPSQNPLPKPLKMLRTV